MIIKKRKKKRKKEVFKRMKIHNTNIYAYCSLKKHPDRMWNFTIGSWIFHRKLFTYKCRFWEFWNRYINNYRIFIETQHTKLQVQINSFLFRKNMVYCNVIHCVHCEYVQCTNETAWILLNIYFLEINWYLIPQKISTVAYRL